MRTTGLLRLKAIALAFLLVGGSLGLPALDLIVWHLGSSHSAAVSRSSDSQNRSDHDRQCVFTQQVPSSQPASPVSDGLLLTSLRSTAPSDEPTPRLISAEVQRAHPPRAPPSTIA
ncbi:MAG: hypothetical protein ABJC74_04850 [Gemmatimonadota bacterium]